MLKLFFTGFFMALADCVPGVSGGTVAFLSGIYERLIRSPGDILRSEREKRREAIMFLLKLGVGWVVGMTLAVTVLANVFTSGIYHISSMFLGLIAASIPIIIYEERKLLRGSLRFLPLAVPGAALVAGLSILHFGMAVDSGNWSVLTYIYVFASGAFAIAAMLLPGISGSSLLLSFGLYVPIITGLKNCLHFDFGAFRLLAVFACGVIIGIFASFRGIRYLMEKHKGAVLYTVIGMMLGSLYAIIQGPATLKDPLPAMSAAEFHPLWFTAGLIAVALLQLLKYHHNTKEEKQNAV